MSYAERTKEFSTTVAVCDLCGREEGLDGQELPSADWHAHDATDGPYARISHICPACWGSISVKVVLEMREETPDV